MGRFDSIHGDEDELELDYQRIKDRQEHDKEEQGIEEWKSSRTD